MPLQYTMSGNHCNHFPENPRWFEPPPQHTRPWLIKKAIAQIRYYYIHPAQSIPSLNLANGSTRQQRSERRESCLLVLGCLLHYLDLASMRVGIPTAEGGFGGITMDFITEKCALSKRRAERAINNLVASHLVTVHPRCEKINDTVYKGFAAIRTLSTKLFDLFGLDKRLRHEREKAAARLKKKNRKAETQGRAKVDLLLATLQSNIMSGHEPGCRDSIARQHLKAMKECLNSPPNTS